MFRRDGREGGLLSTRCRQCDPPVARSRAADVAAPVRGGSRHRRPVPAAAADQCLCRAAAVAVARGIASHLGRRRPIRRRWVPQRVPDPGSTNRGKRSYCCIRVNAGIRSPAEPHFNTTSDFMNKFAFAIVIVTHQSARMPRSRSEELGLALYGSRRRVKIGPYASHLMASACNGPLIR